MEKEQREAIVEKELKEDKNYFNEVCLYRILSLDCLSKSVCFLLVLERHLSHENFFSCFGEERE